jgi:hypothetical protein
LVLISAQASAFHPWCFTHPSCFRATHGGCGPCTGYRTFLAAAAALAYRQEAGPDPEAKAADVLQNGAFDRVLQASAMLLPVTLLLLLLGLRCPLLRLLRVVQPATLPCVLAEPSTSMLHVAAEIMCLSPDNK